jgi:hypothetical protein
MKNSNNKHRPIFKAQLQNNGLRNAEYEDLHMLIPVIYGPGLILIFCI